jgi:8-oxo-dGTP diphosphatase
MAHGVLQLPEAPQRDDLVRAAGGVLVRRGRSGRPEVAVIHRPDPRDDWSLPKGKLDKGETFEECAVREVWEETGYSCLLGGFAGSTEYVDSKGRPKVVAYWLMEPADGESFLDTPSPDTDEVDQVVWLELTEAIRSLTYRHDRKLLAALSRGVLARSS